MFKFLFSRTLLIQIVLALIVVVGVVAGAYFYLLSYTMPDKVVEVPDLNEMDIVEAEAFLFQLQLRDSIIDSAYTPGLPGGMVIKQDPLPGANAKEGRKIYLTLSRYTAEMVKVPNILDQTLALSEAKLKSYGYNIGELTYIPSMCSDCVVGMSHKGEELKPGDRTREGITIDLEVGMDEDGELVSIPVLYGLSPEEAKQLLNMSGLNLGASPCPECETKEDTLSALVYRTDPEPGSKEVPQGSPVNVFLTSNKEEVPEVNLDSIKALLK